MTGAFQHEDLVRSGVRAAVAVAREQGLPTGEARVLSARGNLVVHLAPAPVVARVATTTACSRRDPAAWMRRELTVAAHAVARGAAVVPPARGVDPGPHTAGEHPVTLWTYAEVVQNGASRPSPGETGAALAALHAALRDDPPVDLHVDLPWLAPATEQVSDALSHIEERSLLPADRTRALRRRHAVVLDGLGGVDGPGAVLHGDAHGGNLIRVGGRWCWTDLEETCRGPVAWEAVWLVVMADVHPRRYAELAPPAVAAALEER